DVDLYRLHGGSQIRRRDESRLRNWRCRHSRSSNDSHPVATPFACLRTRRRGGTELHVGAARRSWHGERRSARRRPGGGGCSEIHRRSIRNELGGKQDRCRCQDRSGLLQGPPDRKQESRVTQSVKAQRGVAAPFLRLKIAFLILNK